MKLLSLTAFFLLLTSSLAHGSTLVESDSTEKDRYRKSVGLYWQMGQVIQTHSFVKERKSKP